MAASLNWITTYDKNRCLLAKPTPSHINIFVIAKVLSRICRFGGHCEPFHSVAQHSVFVSQIVDSGSPHVRLAALLHDAHEAYWGFGDICKPAKSLTAELNKFFAAHALKHDRVIAKALGFNHTWFYIPEVKHADLLALSTEGRDFMGPETELWENLPRPVVTKQYALSIEESEVAFLNRYRDLDHQIRHAA